MASQGFLLCRFSVLWICGFWVYFKSGIVHVLNVKDSIEDRAGACCLNPVYCLNIADLFKQMNILIGF